MKTCIISFSSRGNGNCAQIGKLIRSLSEDAVLFQFSNFEIHACGKCGYECFADRSKCPYYSDMEYRLLDAVTHSDLAYFILPPTISFLTKEASAISRAILNCWKLMRRFPNAQSL